ncbi:TPA: 30S ribosomal protein S20 [Candidatus Dependentiae bacterium]|nr:MAG: 30S ribosomal protein S20 [candidate division TM6 bacterium GW2011_GWF2_36_131]KKQ02992.1 MAG: 30S ribosomal protein S20 [candidate division TM6 bacterium GW2011_GWE2_36_25]KKQ19549.1 MAG: 30S ribosomal protein S20 [candidate division TM6 bacterium GW2011_GWA2_36_9]HBR71062.1 30S ribosomal protein S20 [Candidatus Dependentiae bacterium]HCU01041.1 30S ribosomal protein S20 [Candidatus Dependentiae bacterium]
MANIKSAKKRARQSEKRRTVNLNRMTSLRTSIKKLMRALDVKSTPDKIKGLFDDAQAQLARAKNKHLIHHKTAARKTSRLAKRVLQTTISASK